MFYIFNFDGLKFIHKKIMFRVQKWFSNRGGQHFKISSFFTGTTEPMVQEKVCQPKESYPNARDTGRLSEILH